jgi:hypothetical protein
VQTENHARSRLSLRAVVLGLLALFTIGSALRPGQSTAPAEMSSTEHCDTGTGADRGGPNVILAATGATLSSEEFGVALEDPDDTVRAIPHPSRTGIADFAGSHPGALARIHPASRPILSPPLRV